MKTLTLKELDGELVKWPAYMDKAIGLASSVFNATPNPRVGCVIVKDGSIIGEGWHSAAGEKHAEIVALEDAGTSSKNSTAFVSLEPCAHLGRTPPCSEALIAAGVDRVVIASVDPDERVSGRGIKALEEANIKVFHLSDFDERARAVNPGFFKRQEFGKPFVRLKLAMSIDGRTALSNGKSKWITSPEARRDVQSLRAKSCAIVTGIGTILMDDPSLTVRIPELGIDDTQLKYNEVSLSKSPARVVIGDYKKIPATAKVIHNEGVVKFFTLGKVDDIDSYPKNVEIVKINPKNERVNLESVLVSLASESKINEVLVEAGPTLSADFIEQGLVDEFITYKAPKILGSDAKPLINFTGLKSLDKSINFSVKEVCRLGADIKTTFIPSFKECSQEL